MRETIPEPNLVQVLGTLESLLDPADHPRIKELRGRLDAGDLRVLLVGEAKRGKSTLANALLGRPVMPTGVTPVTAVPTLVQHGSPERLEVRLTDGTLRSLPLAEVGKFVTQRHNPENIKGVDLVRVLVERGLPHERMVLVDSPGVGSVYQQNTQETEAALASMDLALLVLTADAPLSESEVGLLRKVEELSVEVLVILNKVDLLADDEISEAREFVTATASEALGFTPTTLTCSGRHGTGVAELAAALRERLEERRLPALHRSVAAASRRLAAQRLDEDAVGLASIRALREDREGDVSAFAEAAAETLIRGEEVRRLLAGEVTRLGAMLYEQASDQLTTSTRTVRAALDDFFSHAPRDPGEAEDQGRSIIAAAVRGEVNGWRTAQARLVRQQLDEQRQRAQNALEESARALEQAAQRLLGVSLSATVPVLPEQRLPEVTYDFDPAPDWNQAVVTLTRRHGPGSHGRVARYLRSRVRELVDKHLGRAKLGLQESLEAQTRALGDAVSEAFEEQGAGLARAHQNALRLRDQSSTTLADEEARLAHRIETLSDLRAILESSPVGQTAGA